MPKTIHVGAPSLFVDFTAWAALVLAALAAVLAGLQQAEVASLLPHWQQQQALPPLSAWLLRDLPWVLGAAAVVSMLGVAAAVGLMLRLDWARRVFIGLVAVALAAQVYGLWLQNELVPVLLQASLPPGALPAAAAGVLDGLTLAARVLGLLVTVSACALLGWVMARLMSERVRQEFN